MPVFDKLIFYRAYVCTVYCVYIRGGGQGRCDCVVDENMEIPFY